MTYGFVIYYRFKLLTPEEAEKAREFWAEFRNESWPKDLEIVGNYTHAWGTEWNGWLLVETENPVTFFEFWPFFRDKTRWYIDNTRTIIGVKKKPEDWMH